jgi:L,D-transpeptidase ErfK/SrfK
MKSIAMRRPLGALAVLSALVLLCSGTVACAQGARYILPTKGDSVVGTVLTVTAEHEDTLLDIGRRYGVGYEEIISANPGVDPWLPGAGTEVLIPTRYVLPDAPRDGIVVNLPEHRLYYYPPVKAGEQPIVITYAISTGKMDWKTPLGITKVASKQAMPNWHPPASVRKEHIEKGDPLPAVVPPGPDNPLGEYAMRLGIPGGAYMIHGTNRPAGVGMQVTHGCIRMFPEDIEEFFKLIPVNTKVNLIDQTTKVGWNRGRLVVERHPPLEGSTDPLHSNPAELKRRLEAAMAGRNVDLDWTVAQRVFEMANGVPAPVGRETVASAARASL